jgi:tetraacyldisaccharide 4'-kinase
MIESTLARALLYFPAKLYELGVRARIAAYRHQLLKTFRLNAPVISVGNLTVGGTGKTPCVAFIAATLRDAGHRAAILSRGYKRQTKERVEVSNGAEILCTSAESGDEPFLLAHNCPGVRVVVDRDRVAAGQWLESRATISVFLLDDAYQHLRLARDLNLLLIDATEPLSEAAMIPFGRLREPLPEIRRADAIIITRSDRITDSTARTELLETLNRIARHETPIFFAWHRMTQLRNLQSQTAVSLADFSGKPVAAVSGIARPERFIDDLNKAGMQIALRRDFADHHRYSESEFASILADAQTANAEAIIVTEKDAANLPLETIRNASLPIFAAQIEFDCEDKTALQNLLLAVAEKNNATP